MRHQAGAIYYILSAFFVASCIQSKGAVASSDLASITIQNPDVPGYTSYSVQFEALDSGSTFKMAPQQQTKPDGANPGTINLSLPTGKYQVNLDYFDQTGSTLYGAGLCATASKNNVVTLTAGPNSLNINICKNGASPIGSTAHPAISGHIRIMPLGDSITEFVKSESCPQGYRYELWKDLIDSGLDFEMVGTRQFGKNLPQYQGKSFDNLHHQGIGGWSAYDFVHGKPQDSWGGYEGNIDTMDSKSDFDIVLLHLGVNDSWGFRPVDQYISNMTYIIRSLQAKNPNVWILLATIIPVGSHHQSDIGSMLPAYNQQLANLPAQLSTATSTVSLVDQNAGYNADVDNACDTQYTVHPGPSGAKKMADKWLNALLGRGN